MLDLLLFFIFFFFFKQKTAYEMRISDWSSDVCSSDLQDRRVEITGPTDRKMVINALNSGAKVFMADCEDSLTPTWDNVVQGQINQIGRASCRERVCQYV